ncbi:PREDICTED: uncharacterized protein LOC108758464 [Trachymyrmex cornetzi]|uniref:uncharacterized protein LOC108758464 n=1 Tax=Trachymyrmex cornetzi TaxID=471704 RepID=UPI00084F36D3|nr:PREDICTED: uncharacterized protein LOC108758464 [Trachymyrmex cornetzi]
MTSVERGENVTVLACMNAAGHFIPPFVLFKGVRKRDDFMIDIPPRTEIFMTEKGWVTEEAFKAWLSHFNRFRTKGKVILILDGHLSHTNLTVVDLCEESDIELILIPPHTSHAIQPLDVSFFKPLKIYYHQRAISWQHSNVGKGITRIVFGILLKHAWNLAASIKIATKGFEKIGIYPFNPHAIPSYKFVSYIIPNDDLDFINISATEKSSTSNSQNNVIVDPSSTSIDTHATVGDDVIATTIKSLLPTPHTEKQIPAKELELPRN